MAKKQRYWVCNECGLVWHRRLHDKPFPHCGALVRAARKYPQSAWRKHQRLAEKRDQERARLERRHAVPRTCYGYRLRLSKETRKIFREVVAAKQRRSFQKRASAFIQCLREDIWTCPHQHGGTEREGCECAGGGLAGAPAVRVYEGVGQGLYTRRIFNGEYGIAIAWNDRIETLLHEAVHYIDDMGKIDDPQVGSHSRSFYNRIANLKKQLGWQGE